MECHDYDWRFYARCLFTKMNQNLKENKNNLEDSKMQQSPWNLVHKLATFDNIILC